MRGKQKDKGVVGEARMRNGPRRGEKLKLKKKTKKLGEWMVLAADKKGQKSVTTVTCNNKQDIHLRNRGVPPWNSQQHKYCLGV
jgi:hypothetical protein